MVGCVSSVNGPRYHVGRWVRPCVFKAAAHVHAMAGQTDRRVIRIRPRGGGVGSLDQVLNQNLPQNVTIGGCDQRATGVLPSLSRFCFHFR